MDTKETTIFNAVVIAATVIGIIILYFIVSIVRQHRRHRRLYKDKIESEITTQEKERTRLAADLHDQLGPMLSVAKFKLSGIENISEDEGKMVSEAIGYIDNISEQVREIANDLMPSTLLRNGPIAAIEEFADQITSGSRLRVSIHEHDVPWFSPAQAIHVFRIAQEIIHNTVKHADATKLVMEFYRDKNKFIIATADDGEGFNLNDVLKKNNGRGLENVRSRTDILGAEMNLISKPGTGTSYTISIPVRTNK